MCCAHSYEKLACWLMECVAGIIVPVTPRNDDGEWSVGWKQTNQHQKTIEMRHQYINLSINIGLTTMQELFLFTAPVYERQISLLYQGRSWAHCTLFQYFYSFLSSHNFLCFVCHINWFESMSNPNWMAFSLLNYGTYIIHQLFPTFLQSSKKVCKKHKYYLSLGNPCLGQCKKPS